MYDFLGLALYTVIIFGVGCLFLALRLATHKDPKEVDDKLKELRNSIDDLKGMF